MSAIKNLSQNHSLINANFQLMLQSDIDIIRFRLAQLKNHYPNFRFIRLDKNLSGPIKSFYNGTIEDWNLDDTTHLALHITNLINTFGLKSIQRVIGEFL